MNFISILREADDGPAVERASKLHMQSRETDYQQVEGASTVRTLAAGRRFKPYDVTNAKCQYEEYVVTNAHHQIVDRSYETATDKPEYTNSFVALPSRVPANPHRLTPRPLIQGSQVAIVAGPEGEEIRPDNHGRVKVWFPWDRRAKKDGTDTCSIRVAQTWAGSGWGAQTIPRIGMEAVVTYIDGDPDRPLITGVVPNADNQVPYPLPANKTRSTFKTKTHKGFGSNELRFEDAFGMEEVYVHAQKDLNVEVNHDARRQVRNDGIDHILRDKVSLVGGDHEEIIQGNVSISVGSNKLGEYLLSRTNILFGKLGSLISNLRIPDPFNFEKGNYQLFVEKNKSEVIHGGSSEVIGVAKSTIVGNILQTTVGKQMSLIVRGCYNADIGCTHNLEVGNQLNIRVGENIEVSMCKDGNINIKGKKIKFCADQIDLN